MERRFVIEIPGELPGRNEAEAAARGNKFCGAALKHKHTNRVAMAALRCRDTAWVPMRRFHVRVMWRCRNKRKDPDNITAGIKYLLDGLVSGAIVTGDRWANVLSISHTWTVDKEAPGVVVELVEVTD